MPIAESKATMHSTALSRSAAVQARPLARCPNRRSVVAAATRNGSTKKQMDIDEQFQVMQERLAERRSGRALDLAMQRRKQEKQEKESRRRMEQEMASKREIEKNPDSQFNFMKSRLNERKRMGLS